MGYFFGGLFIVTIVYVIVEIVIHMLNLNAKVRKMSNGYVVYKGFLIISYLSSRTDSWYIDSSYSRATFPSEEVAQKALDDSKHPLFL